MNIVKHKRIYFIISLLIIIPGIISLVLFGLKLSIDFTGGSRIALTLPKTVTQKDTDTIRSIFKENKIEAATIQISGKDMIIRSVPLNQQKHNIILTKITDTFPKTRKNTFKTVGPTI